MSLALRRFGIISEATAQIGINIAAAVMILNVGFAVRLYLINEAEKRQAAVGKSLTPRTNASKYLCNMSYEELAQHANQNQNDTDDT